MRKLARMIVGLSLFVACPSFGQQHFCPRARGDQPRKDLGTTQAGKGLGEMGYLVGAPPVTGEVYLERLYTDLMRTKSGRTQ